MLPTLRIQCLLLFCRICCCPPPLKGSSRWLVLHRPRLLLGAIKLLMFFLAFVISQSVFFAAFFGTESCFFSRTGAWLGAAATWACCGAWVCAI